MVFRLNLFLTSLIISTECFPLTASTRLHVVSHEHDPSVSNIYVKVFSVSHILEIVFLSVLAVGIIALIIFLFFKIRHMRKSMNVMQARWNFVTHEMGLSLLDWNVKDRRAYYSNEWKANLGYGDSEIGDSISEWRDRIHQDDLKLSIHGNNIDANMKDTISSEYRMKMKDGSYKWVRSRARVVERDETGTPVRIIGFYYDVTQTKETEQALEESRSLLRAQFENSKDMMFLIAKDNSIEMISRSAEDLSTEEFSFDSLSTEIKEKSAALTWKCFETGENQETEFLSGESHILYVRYIPVKKGKEINHVMIIASDISLQRKMEEKERIMQDQIAHADRIMSLGLLVSGVAHEINNPNQYVLSNLAFFDEVWNSISPVLDGYYNEHGDFLVGGLPYSAARDEIPVRSRMVYTGSQKISTIVDELKSFARKDTSQELSEININDTIRSAVGIMMGFIKKSTSHFDIDYDESILPVLANKSRIEQVAVNLIQNACQSLSGPQKAITVRTGCTNGGNVFFTVADEGCGMSRDLLKSISVPFYTTKRDSGGTGLGLYVSRNIIQSYGGSIEFNSEEGKGTVVTVIIPGIK